ncbi:MAG TPA: DNA gyrase subunit A [Gammaproteobacteria bacterium]|nr:DNA gyrase subunit A [Gammaproteobacteria bacterium]
MTDKISQINLEDEMKKSYLDYAMSVIIGRALPDVRDGLKPVHRRVLYAMKVLGNDHTKAYKKSARIVGDVIGKYHPHGDSAVYETIVRMAQDFSLRYTLVDGQGNFGSIDGDRAAAMRYTEVRMEKITQELLADIDKDTVDFIPNYDESEEEPAVLPTRLPNLLINGSAGIAVGMATNIPPHNLKEIIDGCLFILDNEQASIDDLIKLIPAPDFPTAATIHGIDGIKQAYETGRGRVHVRAKTSIEENGDRESIVVSELPYQVNKARLIEKIAELVRDKKIEGISEIRDESDKDGLRVVIDLKRGTVSDVLLNNLYKQTLLESTFSINMVALSNGQPKLMNLKEMLDAFLSHRRDVVTKRTIYELNRSINRAHILEGQTIALTNIDEMIAIIKKSKTPAEAQKALVSKLWKVGKVKDMLKKAGNVSTIPKHLLNIENFGIEKSKYRLSSEQAKAILDLKLNRLTGLEQESIFNEYSDLLEDIKRFTMILSNPDELTSVIREELIKTQETYGDERRTEIVEFYSDLTDEDLIPEEDLIVTLSKAGYAKTQPLDTYQAQNRGGTGKRAASLKDEDFVSKLFVANTHDTLLCFSSYGKVYWIKVYRLPRGGRNAKGRPIVNLLPLEKDERIQAVLPVKEFNDDQFIFMATETGSVKKTKLSAYSRPMKSGIKAIKLRDGDRVVNAEITDGTKEIMLFSNSGKSIRFKESDARPMGRVSQGVRGMRIDKNQKIISLVVLEEGNILVATENGYGKQTLTDEFSIQKRGGKGVIAIQTSDRNGNLIGTKQVSTGDEVMFISTSGNLIRTRTDDISIIGRNTQGVRLIRLSEDDKLLGMEKVISEDDEE